MIQNLILTAHASNDSRSTQKELQRSLAKNSRVQTFTTILHATSAIGLLAIVLLGCMFFSPDLAKQFHALSPFGTSDVAVHEQANTDLNTLLTGNDLSIAGDQETTPSIATATSSKLLGDQKQQVLVTNWLSKRYRVANDAIDMMVSATYLTAKETKLDPLLILSVMAIESRFNPFSESPVGAQGLMQVMAKVHKDRFNELGGVKAALNPVANIKVGAMILRDCIKAAGTIEGGLKRYVGATENETDGGYGNLVLAEYKRLKDVAAGKSVGVYSSQKLTPTVRPQDSVPSDKANDELTQEKSVNKEASEVVAGL